ncbi:potassium channel family protein [Fidelibacter multiformis]|uniref:potassium channel family protein n=1 Tax=Fidelibacter multiformis TaxID=3377529 RepID=UPI0037DD53D7
MRSIAVIGLGTFGRTLALELTERGAQVIAIDNNKEQIEAVKDLVTYAVTLNSMDRSALEGVAIKDVDLAVVCIGDDVEANLLTTLLLKKMGIKKIWARAINDLQREILRTMDIDEIVSIEEQMGKTIARGLISSSISKYIPLSEGHSIAEIKIPEKYVGKTLLQLNPRKNNNVNIVGIKRYFPDITEEGERTFREEFNDVPSPTEKLQEGDILLVAGSDSNIEKFAKD